MESRRSSHQGATIGEDESVPAVDDDRPWTRASARAARPSGRPGDDAARGGRLAPDVAGHGHLEAVPPHRGAPPGGDRGREPPRGRHGSRARRPHEGGRATRVRSPRRAARRPRCPLPRRTRQPRRPEAGTRRGQRERNAIGRSVRRALRSRSAAVRRADRRDRRTRARQRHGPRRRAVDHPRGRVGPEGGPGRRARVARRCARRGPGRPSSPSTIRSPTPRYATAAASRPVATESGTRMQSRSSSPATGFRWCSRGTSTGRASPCSAGLGDRRATARGP